MKNRNLNHKDHWATPKYVYNVLDEEFRFDFDPCPLNHDVSEWDGLEHSWGQRNYVNPPYSLELKTAFVKKAVMESMSGKVCCCLMPVSTSTRLFHDIIIPNASEIRFVDGRIKFVGHDQYGKVVDNKVGMHDSMIVVFDRKYKLRKYPNVSVIKFKED